QDDARKRRIADKFVSFFRHLSQVNDGVRVRFQRSSAGHTDFLPQAVSGSGAHKQSCSKLKLNPANLKKIIASRGIRAAFSAPRVSALRRACSSVWRRPRRRPARGGGPDPPEPCPV